MRLCFVPARRLRTLLVSGSPKPATHPPADILGISRELGSARDRSALVLRPSKAVASQVSARRRWRDAHLALGRFEHLLHAHRKHGRGVVLPSLVSALFIRGVPQHRAARQWAVARWVCWTK